MELLVKNQNHSVEDYIDCHFLHIRNICNSSGFNISSSMCFGLAGAFDFLYWVENNTNIPCLIIMGRKLEAVIPFFSSIGVEAKKIMVSPADFDEFILKGLSADKHVLAYLDRYYLDYLQEFLPKSHFGAHLISIVGLRDVNGEIEYAVNDFHSEQPEWIPAKEINFARNAICPPFSPGNYCYLVDSIHDTDKLNLKNLTKQKLFETTNNMLTGKTNGLNALCHFNRELRAISESRLEGYERILKFQIKLLESFVGQFDETHSFYRRAYSDFLMECSKLLNISELKMFSEEMSLIADIWSSFSFDTTNIKSALFSILDKTVSIYEKEHGFFMSLQELSRKYA